MSHEQLKEYVAQSLAQGMKQEEVRASLVSQGWSGADIDQALGIPGASKPVAHHDADGRRKWPTVVGVLVVALLLGVGGAFAYVKFFAQTPDRRVAAAVNAALAAKSMEYAGSLRIEATIDPNDEKGAAAGGALAMVGAAGEPDQPTKLQLTTQGAYDALGPGKANMRSSVTLATTQVLGGAPIVTFESRRVDGTAYVSLTSVPQIPMFDLSSLAGVWVKIDPKSLSGLLPSATSTPAAPKTGPTQEQRAAIEKALIEIGPVSVTETLRDEDVDGIPSRHYRLAVDKVKLRAFLLEAQKIMGDEASLAYEKFNDDYDKFSKQVEIQTLEIWVGKDEGLPTRLLLVASAKKSEDVPGEGTLTFDMSFKNFGKPIQIDAPSDAKSLEEVFGMLMGGAGEAAAGATGAQTDAQTRSDDTRRISDIRRIQTALELGFSELNAYPDAPFAVLGGTSARVLCDVDGKSAWAAAAEECTGTIYMKEVPADATFSTFVYRGTKRWYALGFALENGAGTLAAGQHCATPDGIVSEDCSGVDSDDDGFADVDEMRNGYNPAGPGNVAP